MQRVMFGGVGFDPLGFDAAVHRVVEIAQRRERPAPFVVTPNVDHVLRLERSPELRKLYEAASLSLADGMPVVWGARLANKRLPARVTGADLLPALCAEASRLGLKVFLLGGPPGAAEEAARRLGTLHVGLRIDTYCPPFGFEIDEVENRKILDRINSVEPDLLFVGVGSPKQELWIGRFRQELRAGICLGIGAAIEFEAGMLRRAPRLMQRTGTEWVWRLLQDPKRLLKRYAGNALFVKIVFREIMGRWKAP